MRGHHPELDRWILEHGYGEVLSRPGLSVREREVLAVVVLGALRLPLQQESHRRGARRHGATAAALRAILGACGLPADGGQAVRASRR
jgi:4-carboxymuconolactone decarboxylase